MSEQTKSKGKMKSQGVERTFEQPVDAPSFFVDYVHVIGTESTIILSLYEPIPGLPTAPEGAINEVKTRLRATVHMTPAMAKTTAELLLKYSSGKPG